MTDQTQRLEIATVKAEVGSNIIYRFTNDAAAAAQIPTDSGDIKNLAQVVIDIQQDGAEKISFATTIYSTTAAGIAATTNGAIFLVKSDEADEIYAVWQNSSGVATDTGKRAMAAQAIQGAMQSATEAAQAAEDSADLATARTARFLASVSTPPVIRDDGTPLNFGDRYVNTESQAEYIYKSAGWVANDSLVAIAEIKDETDPAKGAAMVWTHRPGTGSVARTVKDKIGEILGVQDYSSLAAALGQAVVEDAVIEARQSLTVRIPGECPALQTALDRISPALRQAQVTLLIESGHVLTTGILLKNGDYSNFRIESEDDEVFISSAFAGPIIKGVNASMPTLACVLNAGGFGGDGVYLDCGSRMLIEAECGVIHAYGTGLLVQNGSIASARGSIWRYSAQNGITGAGITAWGGVIDAEKGDVSFSGYYGAQAAHGGVLNFGFGKANDVVRYGVRATDRGNIDFDTGQASRCGVYGVYAFQNSDINAPSSTVNDCGSANVVATNASTINFRSSSAKGAKKTSPFESNHGHNIFATGGSVIDAFNAVVTGAADTGIWCEGGSTVNAGGSDTSGSVINGYKCTQNGVVSAPLGKANNCGTGFYGDTGGRINAMQAQATGCTNAAVTVDQGADISIPKATLTGAVNYGVRALNGSRLNVSEANCQKGASADATDIQCFSGSTITALLSTGGLNRTANTLTAQGVIFK